MELGAKAVLIKCPVELQVKGMAVARGAHSS